MPVISTADAVHPQLAGGRVERERAGFEHLGVARVATPAERAQAGLELGQREGLREVVVGTGVEPVDAIRHGSAGGQHDDRDAVSVLAEHAADVHAADLRELDVEHDGVVLTLPAEIESLLAVGGNLNGVAARLERFLDDPRERRVVLDHKDVHVQSVASCDWRSVTDRERVRDACDERAERLGAALLGDLDGS